MRGSSRLSKIKHIYLQFRAPLDTEMPQGLLGTRRRLSGGPEPHEEGRGLGRRTPSENAQRSSLKQLGCCYFPRFSFVLSD